MRLVFLIFCIIGFSPQVEPVERVSVRSKEIIDGVQPMTPGRATRANFHPKPWLPPGKLHYDPVASFKVSEWAQEDHYLPPKAEWGRAPSRPHSCFVKRDQVGGVAADQREIPANILSTPPMHLLKPGYFSTNQKGWKPGGNHVVCPPCPKIFRKKDVNFHE